MKKLIIAVGYIAAMIVISSCSVDSVQDVKKENSTYINQFTPSVIFDTIPGSTIETLDGVDDKDKTKT